MASAPASVAVAVLVVVTAIAYSGGLPAAHAGANFISRTCASTKDAALCVAVLSADPRSAQADNLHDLADIALDIATEAAMDNGRVLNFLYISSYVGTPKGAAAKVCRTAYLDAVKELVLDARDSFDAGDYIGASQLVESAGSAGDRCEDAFKRVSSTKTPVVTLVNRQTTDRCVVARALIDLLASPRCHCACSFKNF